MIGTKSVNVEDMLREVRSKGKSFEVAVSVLKELKAQGREHLDLTIYTGRQPITWAGERAGLHLIMSGNAFIYIMKPHSKTDLQFLTNKGSLQIQHLGEFGKPHPLILCKGDLIGEFEIWDDRPFLATVFSGLPFAIGHPRTKTETTLIEIPKENIDDHKFKKIIFTSISNKVINLNHLILVASTDGEERLGKLIPCFFAGVLPAMRFIFKKEDGRLDKLSFQDDLGVGRFCALGDLRGIEVSTTFLKLILSWKSDRIFRRLNRMPPRVMGSFISASSSQPVAAVYWRRKEEDQRQRLFTTRTEGSKWWPLTQKNILFFLHKDITVRDYCELHDLDV
ncbi:cyclic nucleotide-binding domain-containing protein [Acidobacteria bacterium AH-259-G07]|nr:cyclic nucleotide-binding domain-containing protein [Acidobacteria bacterium AH-259-G07]